MNTSMFVLIWYLQVTILFKSCRTKVYTHFELYTQTGKNSIKNLHAEVERIYDHNLKTNEEKDDPVCNMTDEEKQALCDLVFIRFQYQYSGYYRNQVAHYMSKLPCKRNKVHYRFLKNEKKSQIMRNMYPCYGRHEIVRTSFIEDDYYDNYYLSSAPFGNAIAVHVWIYNNGSSYYFVVDYVYNINLSKLKYTPISIREITRELNSTKVLFAVNNYEEVEIQYIREMDTKNSEDPICDLEYEKKITLCTTVFDYYENALFLILAQFNKSATYVYDMSCVTKPVYADFENPVRLLNTEQKMFPCFGKSASRFPSDNLLTDKHVNLFYISSSSRRNSIFVYMRKELAHENKFIVINYMGNMGLQKLKPTRITVDELKSESPSTYSKIQIFTDSAEKSFRQDLSYILESCLTEELENEQIVLMIERRTKEIEKRFENKGSFEIQVEQETLTSTGKESVVTSKVDEESPQSTEKMKKKRLKVNVSQSNNINVTSEDDAVKKNMKYSPQVKSFQIRNFYKIGPQVLRRLLNKKKLEAIEKVSLDEESSEKISPKKFSPKKVRMNDFKNLKKEIQKLVAKMEADVIAMIEQNLGEDITKKNTGQQKVKTKKKKSKN